jgi:hypothetical protein
MPNPVAKKHQMNFASLVYPRDEVLTPIKNDDIAAKYAPTIIAGSRHGDPTKLLYRASTDKEGNTYIAYHFVWDKQIHDGKGFMPFLCRQIYSNPKRLHGLVFGPSDVEMVVLKINKDGVPQTVGYSTAEKYNPNAMKVEHKHVEEALNGKSTGRMEIVSWNHLLKINDEASPNARTVNLKAEYFTEELWKHYRMVKDKTLFFRRDRDHMQFERFAVPDNAT